jgi:hypothetical protein
MIEPAKDASFTGDAHDHLAGRFIVRLRTLTIDDCM